MRLSLRTLAFFDQILLKNSRVCSFETYCEFNNHWPSLFYQLFYSQTFLKKVDSGINLSLLFYKSLRQMGSTWMVSFFISYYINKFATYNIKSKNTFTIKSTHKLARYFLTLLFRFVKRNEREIFFTIFGFS